MKTQAWHLQESLGMKEPFHRQYFIYNFKSLEDLYHSIAFFLYKNKCFTFLHVEWQLYFHGISKILAILWL